MNEEHDSGLPEKAFLTRTKAATVSTRYLTLNANMYDTTFQVKVGEEGKIYTLPKGLACYVSSYFRAALQNNAFEEGHNNFIDMMTESTIVFDLFMMWLYSGGRFSYLQMDFLKPYDVLQLYLFADRRQIPLLCNTIIDAHLDAFRNGCAYPTLDHVPLIYANTNDDSPLRRLIIFLLADEHPDHTSRLEWSKKRDIGGDVWPQQAIWDFIEAMINFDEVDYEDLVLRREPCCQYHTHEDGDHCDFDDKYGSRDG